MKTLSSIVTMYYFINYQHVFVMTHSIAVVASCIPYVKTDVTLQSKQQTNDSLSDVAVMFSDVTPGFARVMD